MPSIHRSYHPAHFVFPTKKGGRGGRRGKQAYIGVGVGALLLSSLLCAKYHVNIIWGGRGDRETERGEREGEQRGGRQSRKDSGKFG